MQNAIESINLMCSKRIKMIDDIIHLLHILGYSTLTENNIEDICIERKLLLHEHIIHKFSELIPLLKSKYSSNTLTALHSNRTIKQKYPSICLFRQILKINHYNLIPIIKSNGYQNKKKQLKRYFIIKKSN